MQAADVEAPLVAVVVVGYNERGIVTDCLRSLSMLDYRPLLAIYVDNQSTDGSLVSLAESFPEVVAFTSGGNLGYCGGNNLGITAALDAGARYVLILNPDTVVLNPGFMSTLVNYMQQHPRVGAAGPKVYLRTAGQVQNTILELPSVGNRVRRLLFGGAAPRAVSKSVTTPTRVAALNGCCVLFRCEAIRDVGSFDDDFWCYVDEVDWAARASGHGWESHYVPVESIVHLQKKDGYEFGSRTDFLMKRNTAAWFLKNHKPVSLLVWMTGTLAASTVRVLLAPFRGGSMARTAGFLGKLAASYWRILVAMPGRLAGRETRWCP
jgi:N-acetylglucosaminyl-diphospho-decaprenol L-rhamnosyltransferase